MEFIIVREDLLEDRHITLDAIIESNEEYDLDPRLAKSS